MDESALAAVNALMLTNLSADWLIVCACAILKDRPVCYGTLRLKSRVCAVNAVRITQNTYVKK